MPSWKHRPCDACGMAVAYKDDETPRKLCRRCWDDPLKRSAALFGEDPDADPPGLPQTDREREEVRPGSTAGPGMRGMTGMYAVAVVLAPGWLMERASRKLLGWPPLDA